MSEPTTTRRVLTSTEAIDELACERRVLLVPDMPDGRIVCEHLGGAHTHRPMTVYLMAPETYHLLARASWTWHRRELAPDAMKQQVAVTSGKALVLPIRKGGPIAEDESRYIEWSIEL